tara:strand:- start:816 stop:1673 length:858 start_codon:yes stop_codon:yes gene_type:complete
MTTTITYLSGFDVKPLSTSDLGVVTFTDGRNPVTPNQLQCEAYGYTYDKASGTCSAFRYNTNVNRSFTNESNKIQGSGNSTETGTNNTYIIGENNTVKGLSSNNIVVGRNNEIANGVNNANVFGTKGEATADNSIVLGGNVAADLLGERQSIQVIYGVQTTAGSTVASYLNNTKGTTDKLLAVPENSIMYFHADVVAVRVGGTGTGNLGDYASFVERGVIINESGTLSISRERDAIKASGTTTLWRPTGAISGTNFVMNVRGAANVTIEWCSNITFTQIKTSVAL